MQELFGIPVDTLLVILAVALAVSLGVVAILAIRNRILVKLAVRSVGRRRGRSALIVVGLMLGTTIIAAALTTGDTMNNTIRATAVDALGETDETIAARGAVDDIPGALGAATGTGWLDEGTVARVESAVAGSGLVDGVTGAIVEQVAVQAPVQRQSEPSVVLFAADPARMDGFSPIVGAEGADLSLGDLRPGEVYLNQKAAKELRVAAGDRVLVFAGGTGAAERRVRDVVRFKGAGTADAAMLTSLGAAQRLFGHSGEIRAVLVSNRGGATSGAALSDDVVALLVPVTDELGLEVQTLKQDAIEDADAAGSAFIAFFTTFGTFSIAAGILLIFLIFVMLAAERRGELGIARAIGTRRGHLVEMFTFEGAAYDLAAAAVGAALGALVAFGMVIVMANAFGASDADEGLQIEYAVSARSLLIAFAIGVLLTLVVVAFSAWRVSVMTISTAIRNLPEPPAPRRRRRIVLAVIGLLLGLLLALAGVTSDTATPLMLGVSLALISLVPLLRLAGVPERLAFTACGLAVVIFLMLPWRALESVFGTLAMDFSSWIVAGLMIVVGTVWVIVFNADLLLGAVMRVAGRIRGLAPVLRMSMAYPLRARFRTGTTLAMFTLVVFVLVTGSASQASFVRSIDVDDTGGGFQVRAGTVGAAPVDDMAAALKSAPGVRSEDIAFVGSQSVLAVDARQLGTGRGFESYPVRGLDASFLDHTTFGLGAIASGYGSAREVWDAVRDRPGLAVVDSFIVPRRDNFNFGVAPDFALTGFYFEDGRFDPIPIEVLDKQTGATARLTVVGILKETAPFEMIGISTSQQTLTSAFPGRTHPTIHYFGLAPGADPEDTAAKLESAFLENGLEAQSIQEVVDDTVAASMTFNRLIQGFMGLGLIVGVAALGVISARAVVERRQQIGVMRAIGFRRQMVQAAFLLESSFVALTAIVVGTALGLLLAWNIVDDQRQQPSWENLTLHVPWLNLFVIFVVVYVVALLATLAPAVRASRIRPAEALRYQ
ncbi:MAG: FtsX-like permease family protein [Thermoleophilia bacterium]|nr:FtsX-like permease family protein [Thermoleophilia bacterium]MDH4338922.1 FtsX-like permease family protein [Thermoleophilia bacterium]